MILCMHFHITSNMYLVIYFHLASKITVCIYENISVGELTILLTESDVRIVECQL